MSRKMPTFNPSARVRTHTAYVHITAPLSRLSMADAVSDKIAPPDCPSHWRDVAPGFARVIGHASFGGHTPLVCFRVGPISTPIAGMPPDGQSFPKSYDSAQDNTLNRIRAVRGDTRLLTTHKGGVAVAED